MSPFWGVIRIAYPNVWYQMFDPYKIIVLGDPQ